MHRAVEDRDCNEREMGSEAKLNSTSDSRTVAILRESMSETAILHNDQRMEDDAALFLSITNTGSKLSPSYVTHRLSF